MPSTFAETVRLVEKYVLTEIERETAKKQLYYHTVAHALAVKRRANFIFQALEPVLKQETHLFDFGRSKHLLDLCAIAHDMVQNFVESTKLHSPRKRPVGVSERATTAKLIRYIRDLNQKVNYSVGFTSADLSTIEESIAATICDRDPLAGKTNYSFSKHSIYQPYLYNSEQNSIVAQIIALADLGTLGIDGIESYLREGVLILLEDNPDLVELVLYRDGTYLTTNSKRITTIRLLNMTRFMVDLARERYTRFPQEIIGFSDRAKQILQDRVFKNLTLENVREIERLTPTSTDSSLAELLDFFSEKLNGESLQTTKK
ncbi:hypothetical protein [Myxosarcina sp. GI1]|uniref:hypothetical protein n=1 Tax=Myxosarcina sp. GI1 TaxID=1541065 RepID=UPI0012E03A5B|nr:hypothetical protein [Myxosarcina sp. GI1]